MMHLLIIAIVCAGVFAVALRRRALAVALVAALLPTYTLRTSIGGVPTTLLECAILTLCAVFLWDMFVRGQWREHVRLLRENRSYRFVLGSGGIFICIGILSLFVSPDIHAALGILRADIITPALFACTALMTLRTEKDIHMVLWALLASGVVIASIAIVQFATAIGIPSPWDVWPGRRATGVYGFPNAVGLYLAPLSALCVGLLLFGKDTTRNMRTTLGVVLAVLIAGIVCSRSDGAVAAVAVAFFAMMLFTRFRVHALLAGAVGLAAAFALPATRAVLLFQDVSGQVRLALWQGTVALVKAQPLFGAGLGGFPSTYDLYRLPSHVELLLYPHNELLNFWVELGLAGAVWIVVMVLWFVARAVTLRRIASHIALPLLGVLAAYVVYGLVDVPYFKNDLSVLFWLWVALLALLQHNKKSHS